MLSALEVSDCDNSRDLSAAYLIPLTIAFVALASVLLFVALTMTRRAAAASRGMAALTSTLENRAATLPVSLSSARAALAEQSAAAELALWRLHRLDGEIAAATTTLANRRTALDELRGRLERARAGVERLKSAIRLIIRALELRRATFR
jgi:hypothetical protein